MSDSYRTITSPCRAEIVVSASRFIAGAIPVADEDAATSALNAARREFHAATHHCWGWRIGIDHILSRSSDDGEPSGTAGKPILSAIEHHDLTNIMIIVTRYFGGTKLGTGGLARAYAEAAAQVLARVNITTNIITVSFTIDVAYDVLPKVKALVFKEGQVTGEEFGDTPRLHVTVPRAAEERLKRAIVDAARGRAEFGAASRNL